MIDKPVFTDDELYLIEREFDRLHSLADRGFHQLCDTLVSIGAMEAHKAKEEKRPMSEEVETMSKHLMAIGLRMMEAHKGCKGISDKIEKWRRGDG
jgi:hypothetical protein